MLCIDPVFKEEVEILLADLALDDVASVDHRGSDLFVRFPVYGDECSLADALDYSSISYTKTRRS